MGTIPESGQFQKFSSTNIQKQNEFIMALKLSDSFGKTYNSILGADNSATDDNDSFKKQTPFFGI